MSRSGSSSSARNSEARLVAWASARLVRKAREIEPAYAGDRPIPAGSHHISHLLSATDCFLAYEPMDGMDGMVIPRIGGVAIVVLNRDNARTDSWFTIRHELAHVLAGEVDEPTFLDGESEDWSERVADTFALADLVPAHIVRALRGGRRPWRDVLADLEPYIAEWTPRWPAHRVTDRARLRVLLWRAHGV